MNRSLIVLLLLLICVNAFAQEEAYPPCVPNKELSAQLKVAKSVEALALWDGGNKSSHSALCTSLLKPSKPYPEKYKSSADSGEDQIERLNYDNAVTEWECQYSPANLSDNDPQTAWVEGVTGDGIGEIVLAALSDRHHVEIWNGYGKSEKLFKANNHLRKIRVYLLVSYRREPSVVALHYSQLELLGTKEMTLKDFNGFQAIDLASIPQVKLERPKDEHCEACSDEYYFVGIEILSVYKGTLYSDTCLSEIR